MEKFNGHMFPGFRLAAVVLTMSMSMSNCTLMLLMSMLPVQMLSLSLFYLDPGAVFDVDCASGVNGGVDVSVDVDM